MKQTKWQLKEPLLSDSLDKQYPKYKKQLEKTGISDDELWNLDMVIAEFILPRLKRFKDVSTGYPKDITNKQWQKVLKQIIEGLELIKNEDTSTNKKQEKIIKSLDLFHKHYFDLWC